jgi:hypothetical protein
MADDGRVTNWPDGSDGKSTMDLYHFLREALPEKKRGVEQIAQQLHLVAACRRALHGLPFDLSKVS